MMEWQRETTDATEFMESLKGELVADEVFVFTPKGDVVSLPSGATPIDFAYHVHTEVGHRTIGAKVNDRIVPLDSELVSGDRVEVITGKNSGPEPRLAGRGPERPGQEQDPAVLQQGRPRGQPEPWDARRSSSLLKKRRIGKVPSGILEDVARATNYSSPDDMFAAVGAGVLSAENVASRIVEQVQPQGRRRAAQADPGARAAPAPRRCRRNRRADRGSSRGVERHPNPPRPLLHPDAGRRDRRVRLAGARRRGPLRGLRERQGASGPGTPSASSRSSGPQGQTSSSPSSCSSRRSTGCTCSRTSRRRSRTPA